MRLVLRGGRNHLRERGDEAMEVRYAQEFPQNLALTYPRAGNVNQLRAIDSYQVCGGVLEIVRGSSDQLVRDLCFYLRKGGLMTPPERAEASSL